MAKKKRNNPWRDAFIILGIIIILIILVDFSVQESDDDYQQINYVYINEIDISGIEQIETIYSDIPIKLILSGIDNVVTIPKETQIEEIILSGVDNTIILCKGIHMPIIQKSGVGLKITYKNC
jgi:hypothetical protein